MKKIAVLLGVMLLILFGCTSEKKESEFKLALQNAQERSVVFNELVPFEYDVCYNLDPSMDPAEISAMLGISYFAGLQHFQDKDTHLLFVKDDQIIDDFSCSLEEESCIVLDGLSSISLEEGNELRLDKDESGIYRIHVLTYQELPLADLSHSVFLGNSKIEGLFYSGLIPEADFICKIGWNVANAFEETDAVSEELLIDKLDAKEYDKVFLMFGDNELGWYYPEIFIEDYKALIQEIKTRQSGAGIYVMSIFPVSQDVNDHYGKGVTNENIVKYNEMLKQMCIEEEVGYLDIYAVLADENGALPEDASSDGMHPYTDVLKNVVEYIKENAKL